MSQRSDMRSAACPVVSWVAREVAMLARVFQLTAACVDRRFQLEKDGFSTNFLTHMAWPRCIVLCPRQGQDSSRATLWPTHFC